VEYGSTPYMLFYLAETSNIVLMSGLMAVLFLGGWHAPWPSATWRMAGRGWPACTACFYALKTFFVFFMNAMVRSIVPRYRYDQLMRLGGRCSCRPRWWRCSWSRLARLHGLAQ
jgi:NADH-quinone oxidoreductase subunit H